MATRDALATIGRQNVTEEVAVEIGKKTIRDVITKALTDAGMSEAAGFELKLTNGETVTISSDSNPVLDRPAETVSEVKVRQSARAGALTVETTYRIQLGE